MPQTTRSQSSDLEAGLYNIGIGAVIGGVGAIVNKDKDGKFWNTFIKGFSQGALGGYLVFESKRLVREFVRHEAYGYVWPSKLINSMGSSIIENSAANRDFWEEFHFTFGFNRLIINFKEEVRFRYRIMPFAAYTTFRGFTMGDFKLKKSLQLGTFVFGGVDLGEYGGGTLANTVLFTANENPGYRIQGHELVHVYQYEGLSGLNSILHPIQEDIREGIGLFPWYSRIFYTDYNDPVDQVIYRTAEEVSGYEGNFLEREAYYYSF